MKDLTGGALNRCPAPWAPSAADDGEARHCFDARRHLAPVLEMPPKDCSEYTMSSNSIDTVGLRLRRSQAGTACDIIVTVV
jgi:hypothetical protein